MSQKQYNQSGFSHIILLVLLVVIAGLIFGGWRLVQGANMPKTSHPNDLDKQISGPIDFETCKRASGSIVLNSNPEQCETKDGQRFAQKDTNDNRSMYLTIKEWGVRLPLTEPIADAYYVIRSDNSNIADLSLLSLKDTLCAANEISPAAITRIDANDPRYRDNSQIDPISGEPYYTLLDKMQKIGNYHYEINGGQSGCSEDQGIQKKASDSRGSFLSAQGKIEAL